MAAKDSRALFLRARHGAGYNANGILRICNMGSSLLLPATSVTGVKWSRVQVKGPRFHVRASLDTNVSDMSVNAPKGLFLPEPEHYRGPKLKVAIIGAGLAGMSTAVELLDHGHEVDIYESRSFIGGKVGSFVDKRENHIEMGLHVFFGCYNNLFRLMKMVGVDKNLLMKDHTHTFVNKGGEIGELDFRFLIGAPLHGIRTFLSTNQLKGGTRTSIQRMWDPVAYALGFIDCDNISAHCSILGGDAERYFMINLLTGKHLLKHLPCLRPLTRRLCKLMQMLQHVMSLELKDCFHHCGGWREMKFFNNIYELVGVHVVTVQLRYNGWVTELQDLERSRQLRQAVGLDNLLYTPDADFSCFADLALTSPEDYYREGSGVKNFLSRVLTPGDPYMPLPNDEIIRRVAKQVLAPFPSSQGLEVIWSSFVKIGQSMCGEGPGKDPFRRDQKTPVKNFFLTGSYAKQIVWKEQLCLVDKPQATYAMPGKN
ncbi:Zeta-carotene desaturase /chromoplastic [Citrus sinensis]|uniref:Zeta-carotene desaturase /chromoplastic n=1 Tax=Citrus sinensis TaxID=2711 RepID=A0ACB8KIH4_CITSI|nr:Zeta-carotene desaturase /chromoplastic [Citrus sinensis]